MTARLLTKVDGKLILKDHTDKTCLSSNLLVIMYSNGVISSIEFTDDRGDYIVGVLVTLKPGLKSMCNIFKHGSVIGLVADISIGNCIANNYLGETTNDDRIMILGEILNKYCDTIYNSGIIAKMENVQVL